MCIWQLPACADKYLYHHNLLGGMIFVLLGKQIFFLRTSSQSDNGRYITIVSYKMNIQPLCPCNLILKTFVFKMLPDVATEC